MCGKAGLKSAKRIPGSSSRVRQFVAWIVFDKLGRCAVSRFALKTHGSVHMQPMKLFTCPASALIAGCPFQL